MNDKNQNSAKTNLLNIEDKERLIELLEGGSDQDFGVSWMPLSKTELHYRIYREEGQLYVGIGKVCLDDSVEIYSMNAVRNSLKAIESELKKLITLFG